MGLSMGIKGTKGAVDRMRAQFDDQVFELKDHIEVFSLLQLNHFKLPI